MARSKRAKAKKKEKTLQQKKVNLTTFNGNGLLSMAVLEGDKLPVPGTKETVREKTGIFPPDVTTKDLAKFLDLECKGRKRFPLMYLHLPVNADSQEAKTMAFVAEEYGCKSYNDRLGFSPPTWMDPEKFVRMLLEDSRVKPLLDETIKRNTRDKLGALNEVAQDVFENRYLPWVFDRFDEIKHLISQWLMARETWFADGDYTPGLEKPPSQSKKVRKVGAAPVKK